ncbi:MAG: L,D-transpeptidase catalytic domain protein, partial [Marivirga sp.]|nr:L,D-transpeptidase catalytic domain protein [Marivirga sp.]
MEQLAYLLLFLVSSTVHLSALEGPLSKTSHEKSFSAQPATEDLVVDPSTFEDSLQYLYNEIGLENYDLSFEVFKYGMIGYYNLQQEGKLNNKNLLSIIDFTKSSTKKRFYTIDLDQLQVKYYTYVSHGKNTGEDIAKNFSNTVHSNQSSLGFYVTGETYVGSKGYSLKLDGTEHGYNDKIRERAVVMHDAEYVSEYWIKQYGRLGRSQGCPALPKGIAKEVIDTIKNRTAIFAYYNDKTYLSESRYLDLNPLKDQVMTSPA